MVGRASWGEVSGAGVGGQEVCVPISRWKSWVGSSASLSSPVVGPSADGASETVASSLAIRDESCWVVVSWRE